MIKNYFKIAIRNLKRHKAFSFINIAGLAIGIAACLLLFTVVKYELSYDKFQPNYKNIYRIVTEDKNADGATYNPGIPFPALEALRTDIPEITTGVLMANFGSQVTVPAEGKGAVADKKFIESVGFFFADPQFFKIFNYTWLSGSPGVLKEPNVTVLTKKIATKYFGDWKNAMGRLLKLDNAITVKVAGILDDVKTNSDFPLAIVTSYETAKSSNGVYFYSTFWGATTSNFQLFSLLPKNISADKINNQLLAFSKKNYGKRTRTVRTNFLQPLSDLHFDKRFEIFGDHITNKSTIWTLSLIGLFIIIMACINFINLSTAQAVGRSKEIGIRKVLGSNRKQLFAQVMGETALIVAASVILALGLAALCLPYIKHIASITESIGLLNLQTVGFLLLLVLLVTLFAGLYPAMILSGFKPTLALKNKITSANVGGISLRRGLVVAQFAISQVLIIGTLVAITQMKFVKNADLGFAKDAVLLINTNTDSTVQSRQKSFAYKLKQLPGVESVSFSSDVPSSDNNSGTNFAYNHKPDEDFTLYQKFADENYFNTYGLKFVAGRSYTVSDTINELVVNETLLHKLGVKDPAEAVGKEIRLGSSPWKTIVGVVKDFKTNSLKEEVKPLVIASYKQYYSVTGVKLKTSNISSTQASVEKAWNGTFPEYAYTTSYMDESLAEFYKQDEQLALLYKWFAGIAILISCLGLYGLVSFMAVQKTKEVGIRKVLGASSANIVFLFSKEFTVLIAVAFVVAAPLAYFMMSHWLRDFVYRIQLGVGVFFIAVLISIIIAWVTVGYKAIRAAIANPIKSLRTE